jgi:hypothetical protein
MRTDDHMIFEAYVPAADTQRMMQQMRQQYNATPAAAAQTNVKNPTGYGGQMANANYQNAIRLVDIITKDLDTLKKTLPQAPASQGDVSWGAAVQKIGTALTMIQNAIQNAQESVAISQREGQ